MQKILIAAISENNVIGKDGELPWHYPEDMEHFKQKTTGHDVVMGRKTFESLPESFTPLPERNNIVLTRSGLEGDYDVEEAGSLEEAWKLAESDKVFVMGGASVYRQALSEVDKMVITRIHEEYDGDTYFPRVDWDIWEEVKRDDREELSFIEYVRND